MSGYFGDGEKDYLLSEMEYFLKEHPVSELLEIVRAAVENDEFEKGEKENN